MSSVLLSRNSQLDQIYDPQKGRWRVARAEEEVRQQLVLYLREELGFPSSLISVEVQLKDASSAVLRGTAPDRRADIICYSRDCGPELQAILLIEVKAIALSDKVKQQVIGYNHYVQAPYVAIANAEEIQMGWYDHELHCYAWQDFLPSYSQLVKSLA